MRRKNIFLLFALSLFTAGAFAGGDDPVIIEIKKYKFIPDDITVKVGTTIRWVNLEKRQYHSVWFREAGDPVSDYFFPDESYERTFNEPGVFPYVCEPHEKDSNMIGVVRVVE
ncbi:MAG: plastocyanin/azurin family copper-binding protein [Chromatiales bacterium]|nr:plastocyanin/azurin family copper-binding protein [Chromatiales bacterium]